ncbi:prolyl aminopeptidase [Aestuariibacter sp. GS-14]|uniref:prolyl aminopeptidase n=1 Tax=Aestuariibacter sp. GS-14 TaxID=2590670 RepID=UPI001129548D|nr:prolyl aminopeptidase [Aestuariibacter sp. GS-14]TPV57950.1 prolyl aminopeptidase [Aestuariibacter sp. GS-14]
MPTTRYHHGHLDVGNNHRIYYECSGNPEGIPVLMIHGGPGAGLAPDYMQLFPLDAYHLIGFEQRGCGRSTPHLLLEHNTTQHLLSDIRQLRTHLGIDKWLLFGGSWGSTLALLAALEEPETVSGLILRGIFLARQEDFNWFLDPMGGAAQIYPDLYPAFVEDCPDAQNVQDIIGHYTEMFTDLASDQAQRSAAKWYSWEESIARVYTNAGYPTSLPVHPTVMSLAVLEWHYIAQQCFIAENEIISKASMLARIPGIIIHGRCDTICKPENATTLHEHWPLSQLHMIPGAGHSSTEPAIKLALMNAIEHFKQLLQQKL